MLKKVSWYSISLVIILLVFSFPLIHRGVWITHDGQNHIARFAGYFQAFHDMQFPPRWAKNLNYTYGSPVLMFFYPLPGYFASILHLLGISFEDSFKVLAFISFILAPVHFYLWISRVVKKSIVAWIGALLYGLAPYHLLDIYVRGDIGELLAFVFIPLVFFAIERFLQTKQIYFILLGSIFYALLMLSHNGISLLFTPILIVYSWMKSDDKKTFFSLGMLFIIGLMLSSFFWIPVLYERRYLHAALFIGDIYRLNFPILQQLIYSAWGFGSEVSKSGGLSPQIGILPFILILTSVLYFPFCKKKMYFGFWIVIFLIFFFLDLQESILIWQRVSLLKLLEFPWRLVAISSFSGAVIVCYLFDQIANPKIIIVFAIFFVASISPFSKVQGYTYKSDAYYLKFPGTTYFLW